LQPVAVGRNRLNDEAQTGQLQPVGVSLRPNHNRKSGCLRLWSGRVAVFFQLLQLDLTRLSPIISGTASWPGSRQVPQPVPVGIRYIVLHAHGMSACPRPLPYSSGCLHMPKADADDIRGGEHRIPPAHQACRQPTNCPMSLATPRRLPCMPSRPFTFVGLTLGAFQAFRPLWTHVGSVT